MNAVRRALAAVAVSGTALAGVGVVGMTAAQAANPVPTSLPITAPQQVTFGGSASVTGKLTATGGHKALVGLTVSLAERSPGATTWTPAGTQLTAADGSVTFSVSPTRTEEVQLVHAATAGTKASASAVASIKVAYAVTASLTGNTVSVTGNPAATGQKVLLQEQGKNQQRSTVMTTKLVWNKTSKTSVASFTITPPAPKGTYDYRVVKPSAHGYLLGVSSIMALVVS